MKLGGLCDDQTAVALRFEWLVEMLEPVSECGRKRFAELRPFRRGDEAAASQRARSLSGVASSTDPELLGGIREALRELPDVSAEVARALLGDVLNDSDLFEVLRFCDAIGRIATMVAQMALVGPQPCAQLLAILEPGRTRFGFYLADAFDETLASRRAEAQAAQAEFDENRARLSSRVARALRRQEIATDEFIVMRENFRGALPAGVHVIREAPTYVLCELDLGESGLAALQRRDECARRTASAEEAVRSRLSHAVRDSADILNEAARAAGELDVVVAAARFAQRNACNAATYASRPMLECIEARFLPLERELTRENRAYVPITLQLVGQNVLTGPNMGGKTVALRTCGFIALCAAFGLPVPARSASVALFEKMTWLGIGIVQADEDLLSSFAREVLRLREVLADPATPVLLLIDELARTTTPHEGRALLLALIARLRGRQACALIATHLFGIARDAGVAHFAVRGLTKRGQARSLGVTGTDEALRALALRMDYRIERVTQEHDHPSDAIELAGLLGLDKELVEKAKEILAQWTR